MKFIGFYDYTVLLTYISLISGVLGMKFAHDGNMIAAVGCLAFSGFCDLFDGTVARTKKNRTEDQKNFGIQLDSLCDIVCFGVLPAIILYFSGVDSILGIAFLVLYVLCALIRLAFFNVLEAKRQKTEGGSIKYFRGLPVTSAAIVYPFFYLIDWLLVKDGMQIVYYILPALMAVLFIADIRVRKLDVGALFSKASKEKAK